MQQIWLPAGKELTVLLHRRSNVVSDQLNENRKCHSIPLREAYEGCYRNGRMIGRPEKCGLYLSWSWSEIHTPVRD